MGSEHYCLRWNNHQSNLLGVFSQLLESESLVDVTLACTEGPSIRAHKVVLSACSSYFQALFLDHPNRHPIVILKDVRFAELRTLVDFMYKGEVNVEYCQLSALLKTAESLKVKGLADMTNINAQAAAVVDSQQQQQQAQHSPTPNSQEAPTQPAPPTTTPPPTSTPPAPNSGHIDNDNHAAAATAASTSSNTTSNSANANSNSASSNATSTSARTTTTTPPQQQQQEPMQLDHEAEPQQRRSSRERDSRNHDRDKEPPSSPHECHTNDDSADDDEVEVSDSPAASPPTTREASPGPLALDRPRSRRDSDSPASLVVPAGAGTAALGADDRSRGSLSPLSAHSGPSDMSLSNNTGGRATPHAHGPSLPQSRLPSPHSTEPLAGPSSGLPPVQQVPLSLKKEVDWERTEERSASSEMSSDYRLPPDPELMGMDERVFACMYCGASFLHQSKLTRHILSHSLESLKYREQAAAHLQLQAQLGLEAAASGLHLAASAEAAAVAAAAASHYGGAAATAAGVVVGGSEPMELDSLASAVHAEPGSGVVLCKFCGKSFPDVGSLISHLPAHTGDRPFKCEFCGKAFKLRHHMKDHCRVHTGERPFRCSLCGKTFSRSTILKAHEKTHYPKYVRKFLSPSPVDHAAQAADEEGAAAAAVAVAQAQAQAAAQAAHSSAHASAAHAAHPQPNPHANPHAHH